MEEIQLVYVEECMHVTENRTMLQNACKLDVTEMYYL